MLNKEYDVVNIADGVFKISENPAINSYLIVGNKMAMLIDTGCGTGNLRSLVDKLLSVPYIVVNTHGHSDHIAANYQFEGIFISKEDNQLLFDFYNSTFEKQAFFKFLEVMRIPISDEMKNKIENARLPEKIDYLFDNQEFNLGNRKVTAISVPGHTRGCFVFLDNMSRILFNGDVIIRHAEIGLKGSTNLEEWKNGLEKLWEMRDRFDLTVAAHGHKSPSFRPLKPFYIMKLISCADRLCLEKSIVKNTLYGLAYEYLENEENHDEKNDVSITYRLDSLEKTDHQI